MPDTDVEDLVEDEAVEVEIAADFADRLRDAQQAYDEVAEYLKGLKDELKEQYEQTGHRKIVATSGGEQIFTLSRRRTRHLNVTRLKKDWPDLYVQYATTRTVSFLSVVRRAES